MMADCPTCGESIAGLDATEIVVCQSCGDPIEPAAVTTPIDALTDREIDALGIETEDSETSDTED